MCVDKTKPFTHQVFTFDEEKEFIQTYCRNHRKSLKKSENFIPIFDVATSQFADYEGMTNHLGIEK